MLTEGLLLTCRMMPVCTNDRKPGKAASNLYGPNGKLGKVYDPVSFVTVCRLRPVSVCVAVISTPGKTAPLLSWTAPLTCAVACAKRLPQVTTNANHAMHKP